MIFSFFWCVTDRRLIQHLAGLSSFDGASRSDTSIEFLRPKSWFGCLSRASQHLPGAAFHLTAGAATLVGLWSLSEYYRTRRYHAYWLREPSTSLSWTLRYSRRVRSKVIPLSNPPIGFYSPTEHNRRRSPINKDGNALMGFFPLRCISAAEPTIPGLPHLVTRAYRFSQPPSALRLWLPSGPISYR
jgi:hypothetical protein